MKIHDQHALPCNRLAVSAFVTIWLGLLRGQHAGLLIVVLASVISLHEIENLEAADGKFVSLFDGKSFSGWEGDTTNTWRIENGMIIAGSLDEVASRNEFLATTKKYENFELRLKFKITGNHNVNAGVQFRTRRIPNHHEVSGFQADIGPNVDGHLYDESRRRRMLATPDKGTLRKAQKAIAADGWQTYRIRADGDHIQIWLNGVQTVDYVEKDNAIDRDGIIAVQIHGGMKATISYKDIRIEELPPTRKLKPQKKEDAIMPAVKVVQGGDPAEDYRHCRRMLVGPGVNQPDPYPGYGGFVGWQSPIVLRNGTMLVGFSSGYWHASPPTAYFEENPAAMEEWKKIGMPTNIDAPRGGRAEIIRSTDGGKTWSKPTVLLDTPWDDRAPNFCQKWGFPVDPSVYGYGQTVELTDGSIWAAYIHTGGHSTKDAKTEALWSIRLRVRPDHNGIDLLPALSE